VIIQDHGNNIAASIPLALHIAIHENRLRRGDRVLILGTSAGFSIGGMVLDY
jgi:3-oxoacyl-[acyl-carrier-protein] synthase III